MQKTAIFCFLSLTLLNFVNTKAVYFTDDFKNFTKHSNWNGAVYIGTSSEPGAKHHLSSYYVNLGKSIDLVNKEMILLNNGDKDILI